MLEMPGAWNRLSHIKEYDQQILHQFLSVFFKSLNTIIIFSF